MVIRVISIIAGIVAFVLLAIGLSLFFIDQPLRGYIESELNKTLKGYSVELKGVDFHPLGFSIDFENLTLRQKENPDPPVLVVPLWTASIQWTQLLKLKIVSDHRIDKANLILRHAQAEKEAKDETELEERGWQEALFALYPVEINSLRITNSSFTFHGPRDVPPLELTHMQLSAESIRNRRSKEGEYPSTVQLEANLRPSGHLKFSGKADFLAEPFLGLMLNWEVKEVKLEPFVPVASLFNVEIHSGTLNGRGNLEYAPWNRRAHINNVELVNPHVNYREQGKGRELNKDGAGGKPSGEREDSPNSEQSFVLAVDHAVIRNGHIGYINQTTKPDYHIFFKNLEMKIDGIGFPKITQKSQVTMTGRFMGEGDALLEGVFQPEMQHPDFDVKFKIGETDMKRLNKIFQAYGNFDVKSGKFSLYSELNVHDGKANGYIKPFFKKPEIHDLTQDKTDNVFQQIYEGIVGGLSSLLENDPRDEVATKTEISGDVKKMNVNTWEVIGNLLKNAFVDALAPTFENLKKAGRD